VGKAALRIFLGSLLLNAIVMVPILLANRLFVDDLARARSGYTGWTGDGRPLSSLVMQILNLGSPLTDLTPLPQFMAIALLAWCAVLIARKFEIRDVPTAVLVAFPLCGCPFFLENLSYHFDVLTMVLAVTLSVTAIAATPARGWRAGLGVLCLVGSLCLYQAALNVFLVFSVLEFLLLQLRLASPRELWAQAGTRVAQVFLALIPYKVVAGWLVQNRYALYHSGLIESLNELPAVQENAKGYFELIRAGMTGLWASPTVAVLAAGLVIALLAGLSYLRRSWRAATPPGRLARLIVALGVPLALAISSLGPLLFLRDGVFAPRTLVGFGALIVASMVLISIAASRCRLPRAWLWTLLGIPAYTFIVMAAVFGNAQRIQNDYENRLAANLADDFADLTRTYRRAGLSLQSYIVDGTAGYAPLLVTPMAKYPFLAELVPVYLSAGWGWVRDLLYEYNVPQELDTLPGGLGATVSRKCGQPPDRTRANYRLYVVDQTIVVRFPNGAACN
jgi:hypothetical protein